MTEKNKLILLVVIVILAIIAGIIYFQIKDNTAEEFKPAVTELDDTVVPRGFPPAFPIEPGSEILQNYQAKAEDGRIQYTREVTTNKSPDEAIEFFKDHFKKWGWEESGANLLKKDNDTVSINATSGQAAGKTTVLITLIEI